MQVTMRLFKLGLVVLLGLLLHGQALAQAKIADDLFDNFEYAHAIKFYENDRANLNIVQKAKLAYSYFSVHNYEKAEPLFEEVSADKHLSPQNLLFLAICQKNNHKFAAAEKSLQLFEVIDTSDFDLKRIKLSIQTLKADAADQPKFELKNLAAANTPMAELSPAKHKTGFFFVGEVTFDESKKRPHIHFDPGTDPNETDYGTAERPLAELFYTEFKDGSAQKASVFSGSEKFHIGSANFNPANGKLYFTRTDLVKSWNADLRQHPRLFMADVVDGKLSNVEKVKIKKFSDEYGAAHPAFSADGKTMYFSSDMPGGFGGADLYSATMDEKGNWNAPVNLGTSINTKGDEIFPSISNNQTLYFSSNGHPGYGHLDLYSAAINGSSYGKPELLPLPLNSVADDFGILFLTDDQQTGIITSNRFGGAGDDDLYYFAPVPPEGVLVQGIVYDYNGNPTSNALVAIYDKDGNVVAQGRTDENGRFSIVTPEMEDLTVIATTKGFSAQQKIDTANNWDSDKALEMHLRPSETVQGVVKDETGNLAAGIDVMLYNDEGKLIYKGKTDDKGQYQFALEQDKTYEVVARKEGYKGTERITTDGNYDSNTNTNIQLQKIAEIFGVVKKEDGTPAPNALVKLLDVNGKEIAQVRTDQNGNYRFSDVEGGRNAILEASINGFGVREQIVLDNNWKDDKPYDLTLRATPTAQGVVYDENGKPAPNTLLSLYDDKGSLITQTKTDEQGRYQLVLEKNKTYDIKATKGNLEGEARLVTDSKYDTQKDINLTLKPRAVIQGVVRDQNGRPVAGATVNLYDDKGNLIATTTTDKDGKYRFDVDKNKNYQVVAITDGFEGNENFFTGDKWDSNKLHDIKLQPSGKDTYGIVTDNKTKSGIDKVKVTLTDLTTGKKTVTYTDGKGKFDMKLSPKNNYVLELEKDGYFPRKVEIPTGAKLPEKIDLNKSHDLGMDYAGFKVKPIYYDFAKADIREDSKEQLDKLAQIMKENPQSQVTVRAYADCRGTDITNNRLTNERAKAVKDYLVSKGIAGNRIKAQGKGRGTYVNNCYKPDDCSEDEHGLNRRAEFEIDFKK